MTISKRIKTYAFIIVTMAVLTSPAIGQQPISEEDLKIALAYKVARFVTWPASTSTTAFRFCVTDTNTYDIASQRLSDRTIDRRPIKVIEFDIESEEAMQCDSLYISSIADQTIKQLLRAVSQKPVLTMSDHIGFAHVGGMIALVTKDKRVGMEINIENYERVGLSVNSQLLQLAELVDSETRASR